jgi:hypothetical protein
LNAIIIVLLVTLTLRGAMRADRRRRAPPPEPLDPRGRRDHRDVLAPDPRSRAVGAIVDEGSPPRPRKVFVLGREATLDVEVTARAAVAARAQLVLLSLGYPVSAHQAGVVGEARGLAEELRLWLDAVLVTSPKQLSDLVGDDDEVTIIASGRERRRIERALGAEVKRGRLDFAGWSGSRPSLGTDRAFGPRRAGRVAPSIPAARGRSDE